MRGGWHREQSSRLRRAGGRQSMIYWLVNRWFDVLEDKGWGFLRVFTYATFRSIAAIVLSFFICIILGPRVIAWLRKQKMTDLPGFDQAEIDALMASKKGTPTMGGILIVFAIAITTLLLGRFDERAFHVKMALVCLIWLAAVGAADDWLKLTAGRRAGSRQGLYSWEKFLFQLGLSVILMWFTYRHGRNIPEAHTLYFPFFKEFYFELGAVSFILLGTLVLTGSSNAVNLTDGLDGLASGCMAIVAFTFFVLALIVGTPTLIGTKTLAEYLLLPHIQMGDEMAVIAGAVTGASLGFLWFNCNPAKVFMG